MAAASDTAPVLTLRGDGDVVCIGHRGAAAVAAENTLASLRAAVEAGVDVVELDVLVVDGDLLLGHSLRELPRERATLDDALGALSPHPVGIHVDVKSRGGEREIVEAISRHGLERRTYVSTFWPPVLQRCAELAPWLPRALSYPEDRVGISRSRALGPLTIAGARTLRAALPRRIGGLLARAQATIASLHYAVVSRAAVERCHALGVPVLVWTVDDMVRARRLEALGVDAIVSNDPQMLVATLRA
jgi:glycerophosphoryl diester phosphodiesterase